MSPTRYKKSRENPLWVVWSHMMQRCYNAKARDYKYYGGRDIGVHIDWHEFICFVNDMANGYEKGLTLDRIDNNTDYSRHNCRWITHKEQCNNRRSNVIIVNPNTGERFTGQQLADRYGVNRRTIFSRMARGHTRFDQLAHKGHLKTYNLQKGYQHGL